MGRRKLSFVSKKPKKGELNSDDSEVESTTSSKQNITLSNAQAQKMVEINYESCHYYLNMYDDLEINLTEEEPEVKERGDYGVPKTSENLFIKRQNTVKAVPDVNMKIVDNDKYPWHLEERQMPSSYVKYMEKTSEELDELIEYDLDEEDIEWLRVVNSERVKEDLKEIKQQDFILIMNRLEKESYFQIDTPSTTTTTANKSLLNDSTSNDEDDAICCICLDGECFNSNVILFCDMCNLAVHQECYGVPYIPEGQWLCRKCIQSPSNAVDCVLCPNQYGAFKQTDDNKWAHMICAIWIPEVHFANTVFLEPIIGIENIVLARLKLMCYICRKRKHGACIQCSKANCCTAFHVTCAQQAGLYMSIQDTGEEVIKLAYCDVHTRSSANASKNEELVKREQIKRIKKAKRVLSERQPALLMPKLSESTKTVILQEMNYIEKKQAFLQLCINYWLLKRKLRSGVPLIRRLQTSASLRKIPDSSLNSNKSKANYLEELKETLFYWKKLRQDLERARLLMELIRKRERVKRESIRLHEMVSNYQLKPFQIFLLHILDKLKEFDKQQIFHNPVSLDDVPTYYETIKEPMDFCTMEKKIKNYKYFNFKQFEIDFHLIINNCLEFNKHNQYFYKAALRLREQVS